MEEYKDKLFKAINNLTEIEDEIENIVNKQGDMDMKISDLLHYIENNSLSTSGAYSIVRELKNVRKERRTVLELIDVYKTYTDNRSKLINKDNRQFIFAEIGKTVSKMGQKYKNRIYTNEEMKKIARVKEVKEDVVV